MIDKNKISLEDVFLEELILKQVKKETNDIEKINEEVNNKKNFIKKDDNKEMIEISSKLMHNVKNPNIFKYILGIDFKAENRFEISLVYDSYFFIDDDFKNKQQKERDIDNELLSHEFNYYLWPYVIEQIANITSKMNIEEKIMVPSYGVISDER